MSFFAEFFFVPYESKINNDDPFFSGAWGERVHPLMIPSLRSMIPPFR